MNCTTLRQHLLASERPERPAPALAAHLAGCPACRGWQRRLVRLEEDVARLPVPPSRPPQRLLEQVLHGPGPDKLISPPFRLRPNPDATREYGRQKLALAFAMAASLAVFALGLWAMPRHETQGPSPVRLAYEKQRDDALAGARTTQERVVRLTGLAERFMENVRAHRDSPDQLADLVAHFNWWAGELPDHARQVPRAERPALLGKVRDRLTRIESQASQLVAAWAAQHGASAHSVRRIAAVVRKVDLELADIIRRS